MYHSFRFHWIQMKLYQINLYLYALVCLSACSSMLNTLSKQSTLGAILLSGTPRKRAYMNSVSLPVSWSTNPSNWGQYPILCCTCIECDEIQMSAECSFLHSDHSHFFFLLSAVSPVTTNESITETWCCWELYTDRKKWLWQKNGTNGILLILWPRDKND